MMQNIFNRDAKDGDSAAQLARPGRPGPRRKHTTPCGGGGDML